MNNLSKSVLLSALLLALCCCAGPQKGGQALGAGSEGGAPTSLRLLYWNVQNGMWSGQGEDYSRFVEWVMEKDPDICVWCEGQANYVTGTADPLPDDPDKYLYGLWQDLGKRYGHEYVAFSGRRDRYAQVVTSKYPIETVALLTGEAPDSIVSHGSGWFAVERGGRRLNIVTLHTWPQRYRMGAPDREASGAAREGDLYRRMEIQYICEHTIGTEADAAGQYWMMMGDFNSRSRRDNYFYKYPDTDTRFLVHDYIHGFTPYIDVIGSLSPGKFITTTGGEARIDFLYCTKPLFDSVVSAEVVSDSYTTPVRDPQKLSNFWHPSDHRPILVDFTLR